jgi:hypothetical protein
MMMYLDFPDAVNMTYKIINYFNSPEGRSYVSQVGSLFGFKTKPGYVLSVSNIYENCPQCSGCSNGRCVLGCFVWPNNYICYTDSGLQNLAGMPLVIHELFHLLYNQAYLYLPPDTQTMETSEYFAVWGQNNFVIPETISNYTVSTPKGGITPFLVMAGIIGAIWYISRH